MASLDQSKPDYQGVGVVYVLKGESKNLYVLSPGGLISVSARRPLELPLVARVAQGRVDGRQVTRVRCFRSLINYNEPSFPSTGGVPALKT